MTDAKSVIIAPVVLLPAQTGRLREGPMREFAEATFQLLRPGCAWPAAEEFSAGDDGPWKAPPLSVGNPVGVVNPVSPRQFAGSLGQGVARR